MISEESAVFGCLGILCGMIVDRDSRNESVVPDAPLESFTETSNPARPERRDIYDGIPIPVLDSVQVAVSVTYKGLNIRRQVGKSPAPAEHGYPMASIQGSAYIVAARRPGSSQDEDAQGPGLGARWHRDGRCGCCA